MNVIADFEAYPSWAMGMKRAEIVDPGDGHRAKEVLFVLDATPIRDEYVLAYEWDGDKRVSWTLAKSGQMLRSMDGAYVLEADASGGTRVTYHLAVDVSVPLLGMLKRKAEKVIIDTALKGLKNRVESA